MGVSSSSMGPAGYSIRAKSSKEFSNQILQLLFERTDVRDLLNLTSIEACPKYVFTTASALSSLFYSLKVYPELGKQGEIFFAPLSKLSPGSVKGGESSQLAERTAQRNKLCMDIAYFYIRIFQIYGALALTVMDTDPTRSTIFQIEKSGVGKPVGPERAPLFGQAQRGGSLLKYQISSQTSTDLANKLKMIKNLLKESKFEAFQIFDDFFSFDRSTIENIQISINGNDKNYRIYFIWQDDIDLTTGIAAQYTNSKGRTEDVFIRSVKQGTIWYFYVNDAQIFGFDISDARSKRVIVFAGDDESYKTKPASYFTYRLKKYFDEPDDIVKRVEASPSAPTLSSSISSYAPSSQISISPGQSVFLGFQDLKALFEKKYSGKSDFIFPKSYCIARAMTLLNPIFTQELPKPDPRYIETQVCKTTYDFESPSQPEMPRAGKKPNANTYLKSLVALYYDDYRVVGNNITFTQSETGATELRNASKLLARLYNIEEGKQATFLQSSAEFRSFSLCTEGGISSGASARISKRITFKNMDVYGKVFNGAVKPLLDLQEKHNSQVNNLLKTMFVLKGTSIQFSPLLISGNIKVLNEIGKQAHDLLLNYYLRSEAYYIKGVMILEENKASLDFTSL